MILESIKIALPTSNLVTDGFGVDRDWALSGCTDPETGRPGWHPFSNYRPVHYGVDFSARANSKICAPCDCDAFTISDDTIMCIPLEATGETHMKSIAFYLRHVVPYDDKNAHRHLAGDLITTFDKSGQWAPHLHWECAVTYFTFDSMCAQNLLDGNSIHQTYFEQRAIARNIAPWLVMQKIGQQIKTDGICKFSPDAIIRNGLPDWKRSALSDVGHGHTAIINSMRLVKNA
jgi:hypothetical protein